MGRGRGVIEVVGNATIQRKDRVVPSHHLNHDMIIREVHTNAPQICTASPSPPPTHTLHT